MWCQGIRGATTVAANTREEIIAAARELLLKMASANRLEIDRVACVIFTTTPDLNAEFPALAARELGWTGVALLCGHEMDVPGSLPMCLRVLLLYNAENRANDIVHVYLKGAKVLRPDSPYNRQE